MRVNRLQALVACLLLGTLPVQAQESFVVIDNFAASTINAERWNEPERSRRIVGGALELIQRDYGATTADSGVAAQSFGSDLPYPGRVTQLRAQVRVNAIGAVGCNANPTVGSARARLFGTFFNTGNPVPGSFVGDVLAQVWLRRNSTDLESAPLQVLGIVSLCTSSDCNTTQTIGVAPLGTATSVQNVVLSIEWDRANKRFVFVRDGSTTGEVAYTLADDSAPGRPLMSLGGRTEVPACTSGPRPTSFVNARFDNVTVNRSALQ
jgi:hypothetical protein